MSSDCSPPFLEKLIKKITSDDFDKINFDCFYTEIPEKCKDEPCILGVDEAGRGPVLGPMVYAVCYCPLKEIEIIKGIGCTDSKTLTEKKREEIFELINNKKNEIGWAADVISPNYISNKMQKRIKCSLNEIAQNSTIKLIENILQSGVDLREIYVDTIGPPDKYQNLIKKASEIKMSPRLSTGCPKLDEWFFGGLPIKGITEICGESGSGKSQLCMQLAITVQFPETHGGLGGGVIYICSEEHFQTKRLYQMIKKFSEKLDEGLKNSIQFSNNIFILHAIDYSYLENSFEKILFLVKSKNIKLLVLDSVTALFRGGVTNLGRERAKDLRTIARNFYDLCGEYEVMIVCVNQVTTSLKTEGEQIPALGLVWANLISTRIQLKKNQSFRSLEVIFSPELPCEEICFEICESGIVAV